MSDRERSAAACSSSPPTVQAPESATLNYAFLVHSQKTLTQNLPPRVDNKLLARQKRRRTSPEDHAVLEAEYQRNPKPDKTARANIVSRVSLGEKEVQIWFQNRRQNDRRKSKPLQPHELLAPRSDVASPLRQTTSDDSPSAEAGSSSGGEQYDGREQDRDLAELPLEDGVPQSSYESVESGGKDDTAQLSLSSQTSLSSQSSENSQELHKAIPDATSTQQDNDTPLDDTQLSAKRKRSISDLRGDLPITLQQQQQQQQQTPGGLQVLKSPPSLRLSLSFDGEAMVRREGELTPSPPKGRNSLRIAMSSDGKAVIRTEDEPSPSKGRISMFSTRSSRFAGLRRSSSAVVLGTPRAGAIEKEKAFGRSRDPRNWESFFDTDARSALSTPTSSQSAPNSASPNLMLAPRQRSLTRSLSARHTNMSTSTTNDYLNTPIPQHAGEKRRKLSRTVSSLGRLESGFSNLNRTPSGTYKISKLRDSMKDKDDLDIECGDSDKENWIPGTRVSHVRRRAASHHQSQRPVLKESNGRDGRINRNLTATGRRSRIPQLSHRKSIKSMPELDADVSAFMAGGGVASQEEDLDCVQGLLSLSQGAWR
ncbi:homeobox domain-containing protein [Aspergillus fischeri NRRL 181]|uniref:Homeobox transcription factor, putative n=1 Tax=Neosartorya fischeri (strain ATCC 1020 / DSM 3700 / CBS 544.65 / FGSC A1164 / JCM 1740 / NRRL 181 / WB 181) TaxID=331117 RepID=A1D6K8_NEOFI|nr:homeobox transcription factor, putative [Aspergillus fischeri NRRL 181]EAW21352.1 homeobox transcription factor, putative [Aspergillus fischeri NRRL 181]